MKFEKLKSVENIDLKCRNNISPRRKASSIVICKSNIGTFESKEKEKISGECTKEFAEIPIYLTSATLGEREEEEKRES